MGRNMPSTETSGSGYDGPVGSYDGDSQTYDGLPGRYDGVLDGDDVGGLDGDCERDCGRGEA